MKDSFFGDLAVIGMRGCEEFVETVDRYLCEWRYHSEGKTFRIQAECPRFGSGEGKGIIHETMRGKDAYIITDVFNYGVTYKMRGMMVPMSPDEHYADLKRVISAIGGKARRITVIMPMLYEGRQHNRAMRESLDCSIMLHELVDMGVTDLVTFDAHDPRVQNSIPLHGFDNVRPTYQMLKALCRAVPDISFDPDDTLFIAPDEGAMNRTMYYASVLGIDLGMFYKRRNYSIIVDGKNPIEAHEYLGKDVEGMDVIVVDDMISSGESILDVAGQLKARGAARIFLFATFGLFTSGFDKFDKAHEEKIFDKVFCTNLIYRCPELLTKPWYVDVNLCKYVAYIIDTMNRDETISNLLNPAQRIHKLMEKQAAKKLSKTHEQIQLDDSLD